MKATEIVKFQKPYSYFGNELNSIHKDHRGKVKIAFAYPDLYDIGMSSLGYKILYHMLNDIDGVVAERAFMPLSDMEEHLRKSKIPLFSLESHTPLKDFDFIAFSVQTVLDYTNILAMLELSQIPLHSKERAYPLVFMGGTVAYNPEPVTDFIDFFALGEGENELFKLIEEFKKWKNKFTENNFKSMKVKNEFLKYISSIKGLYVPQLFDVEYKESGRIKKIISLSNQNKVIKDIVPDINKSYFPLKPIVPFGRVAMDKANVELFRGCTRGCRFCQAGMVYRPVREKTVERLKYEMEEILKNTGYEEITLLSLSSSDYSHLDEIIDVAEEISKKYHVSISVPSLRIDKFPEKLGKMIVSQRVHTITFAIEAATERLRNVINKTINEDDIFSTVKKAVSLGFHTMKFYFMIGLPTETEEDVMAIPSLVKRIYKYGNKFRNFKKPFSVHLSINPFMPQPNTVFQWEAFDSLENLNKKMDMIKSELKGRQYKVDFGYFNMNYLEVVLERGDRRLNKVIETAYRNGAKMDGWTEFFNLSLWEKAFKENNLSMEFYASAIPKDTLLPWDHLQSGVSKRYLLFELDKAHKGKTTHDCRDGICNGCGITDFFVCPVLEKNKN